MVDEQSQDDSSFANEDSGEAASDSAGDAANESGSDGIPSEGDLDDLLAQACSLAETISEETGDGEERLEAQSDQASAAGNVLSTDEDDSSEDEPDSDLSSVDAQLADLDNLVAEAGGLLGDGDETPSGDGPPSGSEPEVAASAPPSTIMADLLNDPATPDASTPDSHNTHVAPSEGAPEGVVRPTIAVDATSGIVSNRAKGDAEEVEADATGDTPGGLSLRRVFDSMEPVAIRACDLGVNVLERLDKPFGRVGVPVRRAIGWLAIATFATSLVTLVVSLF